MNIESKNIFENNLKNGINIFLGAGFSTLSKNIHGDSLPIGNELADELKVKFQIQGNFSLPQLSTILENTRRHEFYSFLKERFNIGDFDQRYFTLTNIELKSIYTTNIDNLVFKIFENSKTKYLNDVSHKGTVVNDSTSIDYSALHGCILNDDRKLIFDTSSLHNAYSNYPRIWNFLSQSIEKYPTLFWGYSLSDSGVIQALTSNNTLQNAQKDMWIILREQEKETAPYYQSMGFKIIISDTNEFLDYLSTLQIEKNTKKTINADEEITEYFKNNLVPKNAVGLTLRPISQFFAGNPPIWSDIFSSQIVKTNFYSNIQDNILSEKNTIVLGGPVSGKTTLLMQLAAFTEFPNGHKLIFNNINEHKASLLINIFKEKKVLIFVDNFSDSIESFIKLSNIKNFKLVGFERGHNYGIISHMLHEDAYNFVNITNLTDIDIQSIYDKLPLDQRKSRLARETNAAYDSDSIFEFISRNVKYPTIDKRYESVLQELEAKDPLLAEFLILCSYVHNARTPLSFDMLYSYFATEINNYEEIFLMRDNLKDLIKDYSGDLMLEEDQEYYYPRSIFSAETILKVARKDLLRKVIKHTLYNVPSIQIPFYNIYRKSAYDKNLILKAFPFWEEGRDFYEDVYNYDFKNPYVLQQGALYLAAKKKFTEAFFWIDKAITQTNNKYFSIRNSHAIILFDANINSKEETNEVRSQLDYSMEILEKCVTDDKRKLFHAIRFAEQSIEYSKRYQDIKSKSYLNNAKKWLAEELNRSSWNFEIKRLFKKIEELI